MQPLIEIALFAGAVVLSVLAAAALLKWRKESLAFAFAVESALLAGGAVWLRWPRLAEIFGRPLWRNASVGLVATWAAWGVLAAAMVAAYANNNWDDADYCLSGLALRGYPVNYASSRPPFTHLVAALFADAPQFAGAALIVLLVALLSVWSIRRWGWTGAALPLALLATQNVFLERLFGFTSELPAAVLLVAAFLSLARERFALAGVLFACAGLARWNLSVIPLVLAGCVALRFGWKSALHFAAGGAAVAAVFLGLSFALVAHPIQRIIEGNLVPAYAWAEIGEAAPDLLSRSGFYLGHFFFLTPPAVLALAMSLCTWRRGAAGPAGDWCVRCAIPAGLAAYALAMLNIGGHFPRFMAPVVPLAFFTLADFLLAMPRAWRVAGAWRARGGRVRRGGMGRVACRRRPQHSKQTHAPPRFLPRVLPGRCSRSPAHRRSLRARDRTAQRLLRPPRDARTPPQTHLPAGRVGQKRRHFSEPRSRRRRPRHAHRPAARRVSHRARRPAADAPRRPHPRERRTLAPLAIRASVI